MPPHTSAEGTSARAVPGALLSQYCIQRNMSKQSRYWLTQHVHIAATPSGIVILDLLHDRYLSLTDLQSAALASLVAGWPTTHVRIGMQTPSEDEAVRFAEVLVQRKLLTTDPVSGKCAGSAHITDASSLLAIGDHAAQHRRIGLLDIWRFLLALVRAKASLKLFPISKVVARVQRRRRRHAAQSSIDLAAAAELVDKFRRLRAYCFTSNEHCLLHALTLVDFLAQYGIFPRWMIGVTAIPFAAHSWVQEDRFVFDESPEEVCFFTPILAV